jgi:hypothetical protein
VIPGDDFIVGPAPPSAQIPLALLGEPVVLSYRQGEEVFDPEDPSSPITLISASTGPLSSQALLGPGTLEYGFRIELIREGVYGTLLVDTLIADIFVQSIESEGCPDITVAADETPVDVILDTVEVCPPAGIITEEAGIDVLVTADDL